MNGFEQHDGSLKAINGSHLFRDHGSCRFFDGPNTHTNHKVEQEWCAGKVHPITGKPLEVEVLAVPRGSVVVMHTHAAHGVSPRKEGSGTSSRGRASVILKVPISTERAQRYIRSWLLLSTFQ